MKKLTLPRLGVRTENAAIGIEGGGGGWGGTTGISLFVGCPLPRGFWAGGGGGGGAAPQQEYLCLS